MEEVEKLEIAHSKLRDEFQDALTQMASLSSQNQKLQSEID